MTTPRSSTSIYIITILSVVLLIISCSGLKPLANETWMVVRLLNKGEEIRSISKFVEVRNCTSKEEKQMSCSAGTSTNFSISLEGIGQLSGGISVGVEGEGSVGIQPGVSTDLGFDRNSGQTLTLDTPEKGFIRKYELIEKYTIISGQALAQSSTGTEKEGNYIFQSSCDFTIVSEQDIACDGASISQQPSDTPSLTDVSIPPTDTPIPPVPTPTFIPASTPLIFGEIANDVPGTVLAIGASVSSFLDHSTRKQEVYAVTLAAGQTLRVNISSSKSIYARYFKPGTESVNKSSGGLLCNGGTSCNTSFLAAIDGTYYLRVQTDSSGVEYTLTISSENVNQALPIANDVPGTVLAIGASVSSFLDHSTRKQEVYAVTLAAGQTLRVNISSSKSIYARYFKPGTESVNKSSGGLLCNGGTSCNTSFLAAIDGTYYLRVQTDSSGVEYTLTISSQ